MTAPARDVPRTRGVRAYVRDGWALGGAALEFVLRDRPLQRFALVSVAIVVVLGAGIGAAAVALRREAGPIGYVVVGLVAYYCLSLVVTAIAVGVAGLAAQSLDSRPTTASTGWEVITRRRGAIGGWAVLDLLLGVPSRAIGSWTVDQISVLLLGFGWSLLSFFAIPAIALAGEPPLATARRSLRLVRRHWGDAVYSTVYLWVRAVAMFGAPAAGATAVGVVLIRKDVVFLGGVLCAAGVAGLALAFLITQVARAVLTVVLYRYAESGVVYPAFPADLLERSVRGPSSALRRLTTHVDGRRLRSLRRRVLGDAEDA